MKKQKAKATKHVYNFLPRTQILKNRNKRIKLMYRSGYSMAEVALHIGVSKTTVFYIIRGR